MLGPNGAGKSTLMRTLATLQKPDAGAMTMDGIDILADPHRHRQHLGYLPQQIGAYPRISARNLLLRFIWLKGFSNAKDRHHEANRLLDEVNLSEVDDRPVATFSGGMLRRFGIALALIGAPRLVVVDEPTAGLDPEERNRFHRVLANVAQRSIVLLSTHIVEDVERLCRELAIILNGKIIASGETKALTAHWSGRLWTKVIAHGAQVPEGSLHSSACPDGTRVVLESPNQPGEEFSRHQPTLEDVYYLALRNAEQRTTA
ncbi:MAG: ATP-binding cassette domain-containing protein [Pseudomonadota bacterium]